MVVTQTASSPKPTDPRKSPWPEIRKARIQKLLPQAMQLAGIDAWVVICRHNNDPLALYVGGENAGGTGIHQRRDWHAPAKNRDSVIKGV
jgi:hypothetical protein